MSEHREELAMPRELAAATQGEQRQGWRARLPTVIGDLEAEWSIRVGAPFQPGGQTAWVAPVTRDGEDLVVKVAWRHPEAEHEADGLRVWDGDGAVVLHAVTEVDSMTIALLMERCRPGTTLQTLPEAEQDPIVAGLLRRLWRHPAPGHRFRSLSSMCEQWAEEFEHDTAERPSRLDPGLRREGIELFRLLPRNAETRCCCTDLHAGNILAAEREPWLLINPKPYVGDPTYESVQHLLNCDARLHTDPDRLLARLADLLELDAERLLFSFAREARSRCTGR